MNALEWLASPVWQSIAWTLVHFLWQAFFLAGLLVLVVDVFGIRRVQVRYVCSLVAFVAMLAAPLTTFAILRHSTGDWETSPASAVVEGTLLQPVLSETNARPDLFLIAQPYVVLFWLLGVVLFSGRLAAAFVGVWRLRRGLVPAPTWLANHVRNVQGRLPGAAAARVWLSARVTQPLALGIARPIVLLPVAWATELPADVLTAIIAHELAHIARRDLWINLAQRLAEAIFFFHPAVWWLSRRLQLEREMCCDALAVAATGERVRYVEALEIVARRQLADVGPLLVAGIRGERKMKLLQRVRNVLEPAPARQTARLWPVGLLGIALPLLLWVLSGNLPTKTATATADDNPSTTERRGPRDGEVRKEGPRDGDRDRPRPREADRDRDARPQGEGRPEVDRRTLARRLSIDLTGMPPQPEMVEAFVNDKSPQAYANLVSKLLASVQKNERRPAGPDELWHAVRQLREEVAALRSELSELRGRPPHPPHMGHPPHADHPPVYRDGDHPRPGDRPREGERPRDGEIRRDGERRDAPRDGERPRMGDGPREGRFSERDLPPEGTFERQEEMQRRSEEFRRKAEKMIEELRERSDPHSAAKKRSGGGA